MQFPEPSKVTNSFEGENMVNRGDQQRPPRSVVLRNLCGNLKKLQLFPTHVKQVEVMYPQLRTLLETCQEAMEPNNEVFIVVEMANSEENFTSNDEALDCSQNQLPYYLDFNGPSFALNTTTLASIYLLYHAVFSTRAGKYDLEIVDDVTLNFQPKTLSFDDMCETINTVGKGYVRSKSVFVILLQRPSDANRIYASIINSKINFNDYEHQEITISSESMGMKMHLNLLKQVYEKAVIDAGSKMGYSEKDSGVCFLKKNQTSIAKKNLLPNSAISTYYDGKFMAIDQKIKNSIFRFNSTNAQAILKRFSKKIKSCESCKPMTGGIVKYQKTYKIIDLVHDINKQIIWGYNFREFSILRDKIVQNIDRVDSAHKRPVWYIFDGMGTQWLKCGSELMSIPAFAVSIHRSAEYVKQFGLDLVYLINNGVEKDFERYRGPKSFVILTSIQVGLVDLLSCLGIEPDGIIGTSAGEMACAYADGSLTQEQTILSSYWRGKSIQESEIIEGEMVMVGLSREEIKKICPEDIDIAVHVAADCVTIAGPKKSVKKFNGELTDKGIITKTLETSDIPFHSRYLAKAGAKLKLRMDKIIPYPKQRSSKWLSTSVPDIYWGTELNRYCSGDYFVNNLLQPVYFFEVLKYVPTNAITIEVSPNSRMSSVLKKSMSPSNLHLSLQKKLHPNNIDFLLDNLGRLFDAGVYVNFSKLYSSV